MPKEKNLRLIPTKKHSTTIKNRAKSEGRGGEYDFQNYHITRFRCSVFNNNSNNNTTPEMWPI